MHEPPRSARIQLHSYCTGASRARRVPQSSEKGVGLTQPLTRPRDRPPSSELLRDSASQLMPEEEHQQGRGHGGPFARRKHPQERGGRGSPRSAWEASRGHICLSCLPPGCHLPVALGSRHSQPQLPGYLSLGPAGQPCVGPGARLVTDLCSQGPAPGRARAQCACLSLEPRGTS